eukprot:gnl/MRDRNA2_/MRDRNA2_128183_c0_seq1.p1 gnl/MRDRNA2_/MRDRNA2_128183_c0~~gnl/MRDRNA2_/MRDRNA2_128183_c0_seq1.p1  ORF type:complete len:631 (+),score=91.12 gnl/MRDRNA2_/MRDRNA2_128183_c0_seq1:136-2028(+)
MTRGSHAFISRGTQAGNDASTKMGFEIHGSAIQLKKRLSHGGDSERPTTPSRPSTPSNTKGKPSFAFRPGSRTANRAVERQAATHSQVYKQKPEQPEERQQSNFGHIDAQKFQRQMPGQPQIPGPQVSKLVPEHEESQGQISGKPQELKQKPEQPEPSIEAKESDAKPPIVPTWEGGCLREPRTPQRPGSAASAMGLARSASVPNVRRPSSAPTLPSNKELEVEIKKDPAKWYIPENTYRTQYMEDYSDVTVENANGVPRTRSITELRREMAEKKVKAKQSMTRRPSTSSLQDLTSHFYTSETAAQFRKYSEKEVSDCRGTLVDWQTNEAIQKRTDQLKEDLSEKRHAREVRRSHRPPKVPLKQDSPTSSGRQATPTSSGRRPKSLADLLNMQKGQTPVPNRNPKPCDDAASEATTESAATKEGVSEVCSLDSARTDGSVRTTTSSVYSSRSSASCRSSRSSASTRSASSNRSSASLRSSSSNRSSSKDSVSSASVSTLSRSSRSSKKDGIENLEKVSVRSDCGSSLCSKRPSTSGSESSASSAVTWTNQSVKSDSSRGSKYSGTSVDRLQLESMTGHERPNIPNLELDKKTNVPTLELDKKTGELAGEPKYKVANAHEATISVFSRHIG